MASELVELLMSEDVATHDTPIWRERSNFIIAADIKQKNAPKAWEQLWVRKIDENRFELCCIPFFCYDLALGDEVETGPANGKRFVIQKVVRSSGRFTFRVWFGESKDPSIHEDVLVKLTEFELLFEWSSKNLLAIDAPNELSAQKIADYLYAQQNERRLKYETGRTGSAPKS